MLELYQAYSDYRGMMELIKISSATFCPRRSQKDEIKMPDGEVIDFMGEWRKSATRTCLREVNDSGWFELRSQKRSNEQGHGIGSG